jgi:hypothetical protein
VVSYSGFLMLLYLHYLRYLHFLHYLHYLQVLQEGFLYIEDQDYFLWKSSTELCFAQPCYHLNYHSCHFLKYFAISSVTKMEISINHKYKC